VLIAAGLLLSAVLLQDTATAPSASRSRVTALPIVSYSDVTGLQYGATIHYGFRIGADSSTRASSLSAYASRTAKGHAKMYAQLERWSPRNSARLRARIDFLSYPLTFFGIGNATDDDAEEWYSHGVTTVQFVVQPSIRHATYVHAGVRYLHTNTRETEPGGVLAAGAIPGSSGSVVLINELGIVFDSRDHQTAAQRGTFVRLIPSIASKTLGADFAFRRMTIDARGYRHVPQGYVLAAQLQYDGLDGTAPFDQMPMIGADTAMRGYARGRYRDQHAVTAQAEFRSGYWRRVGLVAFAGGGTVAPSFSRLTQETWYPTLGAGLRVLLVPRDRTIARVDFGAGRGSFGISVGIGEAF
jgi:hypothetical protein